MGEDSRGKYLVKNTAIFAFGNISTKLIHFFLVPLYTYTLTTEQYGKIDLIISISSMLIPIMMCNIGEAIRRYLLDKNNNDEEIQTVEYIWNFVGLVASVIVYLIIKQIPNLSEFAFELSAYPFTNCLFQTVQDYLRGKEKLKLYIMCSVVSTLGVAVLNIIFLVWLKQGIRGYFLSYIIIYLLTALVAFFISGQYKNMGHLKYNPSLFKKMSLFSITLVPNSIMWWITNTSDRLMVTYFVSAAANGIYSVSYKLPSMMSTLNTILMQAWQYSAIKEADSLDKEEYNNRMFKLYFASSAIVAAGLLFILKPFMCFYVAPEYIEAWKYSPFLIVGLMFQTLGTFVGTSYYVEKDMKGNLISSTVGAVTNIILNFCFIPLFGTNGAAIATCISYITVLAYRIVDTKKYLAFQVVNTYTIRLSAITVFLLVCVYIDSLISYGLMLIGCSAVLYCTKDVYIPFIKAIKSKIRK